MKIPREAHRYKMILRREAQRACTGSPTAGQRSSSHGRCSLSGAQLRATRAAKGVGRPITLESRPWR